MRYEGARPHAVTSATVKGVDHSYEYDAAGHVIRDLVNGAVRRSFQWTSDGQLSYQKYTGAPALRTVGDEPVFQGASEVESWFHLGAGGDRYFQLKTRRYADASEDVEKTLYLGSYERETHGKIPAGGGSALFDKTVHRHSIGGFAVYTKTVGTTGPVVRLSTLVKDHLGSTNAIVTATWNGSSFVPTDTERQSFDSWGERRDSATLVRFRTTDGDPFRRSATDYDRGYTGHEQLDDSGLIHMNGRIYDPELGRMLSPDPFVQIPEYSQNFNRYSYVLNNPLNKTDPSGYSWLSKAFDKVGDWFSENWRTVASIVVTAVLAFTLTPIGAVGLDLLGNIGIHGGLAQGAVVGTLSGTSGSAINGGNAGDILRGAVVGGIQGGIAGSVLHGWESSGWSWETARHVAGHGVLGGAANEAMGGKFQDGFIAAAASAAAGDLGLLGDPGASGFGAVASRIIRAAAVGGTATALGGGKFANGAWTSAFQHLLNAEAAKNTEFEIERAIPVEIDDPFFDTKTNKLLNTLNPVVKYLAHRHLYQLRRLGIDARIISGTRTYQEQNEIYAQGRTRPGKIVTKAKGGYSNHNFGIAYDIGIFTNGGKIYLDESPLYIKAGEVGMKIGLEWGGSWKTFKDLPHYQYPTGKTLAQLREAKASGLPIIK